MKVKQITSLTMMRNNSIGVNAIQPDVEDLKPGILKKGAILLAMLLLAAMISANAQTYSKGTNVVSGGIGLGSSIAGYTYGSQSPAISLQYERGISAAGPGVISGGLYVGFKTYKYSYDYTGEHFSSKWKYTIVGVRGAYHLTELKVDNLDLYAGLMLSYNNLTYSDNSGFSTGSYGNAAGFSAFAGGRYYFAKKLGVFVELGYGVAYLNTGLSLKF